MHMRGDRKSEVLNPVYALLVCFGFNKPFQVSSDGVFIESFTALNILRLEGPLDHKPDNAVLTIL